MLAIGWQTRWAALALAGFSVAAAFLFHANIADRGQLIHLEKDLAIAGGLLAIFASGGIVRRCRAAGVHDWSGPHSLRNVISLSIRKPAAVLHAFIQMRSRRN
jgi:hypothetical protein